MVMLCHPIKDAGEVLHLSCLWCGSSYNRSRNTLGRQVGGCLLVAWQRCWSVAVKSIQHMFPATCLTVLHSQSYIFGVICSCSI